MTLNSKATTKQRSRIHHIGLDRKEEMVIKSMFRLKPELADHFVFGPAEGDDNVDLMFVNGDDPESMDEWAQVRAQDATVVPIIVTDSPESTPNERTIKKPLAFKKFVEILDMITSVDSLVLSSGSEVSMKVLVVDDSFPARQYMKLKLEELCASDWSMEVDFADSGENAEKAARENDYDVVFMDVVMPGIDGYETCSRIKKLCDCHVAMLTGKSATIDRVKASMAGCDDFLAKPPSDEDLLTVMKTMETRAHATA